MKTLVQDEAKRLNELLQKAFDCFEVLSCLSTNSNNKSEDNINFIDYLNEYESNSVTESMKQLHVCENKLKSIENTSQLFDSKDISLLRRTHKHTISVCEVLVPIKDDLIERTNTPETDTTTSTPEYTAFLSLFKELCLQTYEFTNSTLEDIDAKIAFSSDLTDKIRLLEESKRTLGIRLNTAKERKEKVEYDLSSEIAMLQSELKELTKTNSEDLLLGRKKETDSIKQLTIEHQQTKEALLSRLNELQKEYDQLVETNYQKEVQAREEKSLLQSQLTKIKQDYTHIMEVISTELISLESAFAIETIEYDELKEHFDAVDAQLAQEAYEQSLMQSFRQVQIDTDRELYEAVCEIQRMIRGWKARTVVQAMKAKKVSGKGKGKGKEAGKSTKSPPKKK